MKTIDVSDKIETLREAKAYGFIELSKETIEKIKSNELPKGNLIEATKLTALYGAKKHPTDTSILPSYKH